MKDSLVCKVEHGKPIYNVELMRKYLAKYEGKEVLLTLERFQQNGTEAQRKYYFAGVVRGGAEFFGWEEWEMHEWLKLECNKVEVVNKRTGESFYIGGSTKPLKKMDRMAFIDRCIRRLAECGYIVPTPEEYFKAISYSERV